jgi:hypothetical protein
LPDDEWAFQFLRRVFKQSARFRVAVEQH